MSDLRISDLFRLAFASTILPAMFCASKTRSPNFCIVKLMSFSVCSLWYGAVAPSGLCQIWQCVREGAHLAVLEVSTASLHKCT